MLLKCPKCGGRTIVLEDYDIISCDLCDGTGKVEEDKAIEAISLYLCKGVYNENTGSQESHCN